MMLFPLVSAILHSSRLDINQKVYIEKQPVLGDGAGQNQLGICNSFARQHVTDPDKPRIRVCGTQIKLTAYLLGECAQYSKYTWQVGACDTGLPSDTCVDM